MDLDHKISAQKTKLRRAALSRRQRLAQKYVSGIGSALIDVFFDHFVVTADLIVAGYWPMGTEADIRPLLKKLAREDCNCYLPVTLVQGQGLNFRKWLPDDDLVLSTLGTFEPSVNRPIGQPNTIFVPLLAFDKKGYRIGYGGGYYDRALKALRAEARNNGRDILAIGVGYAGQQVQSIPHDNFDQQIDWAITEKGAFQFL